MAYNSEKINFYEKVALFLLIVLGGGGIFLGFWQFKNNLQFQQRTNKENFSIAQAPISASERAVHLESLKNKDTDEDGLSDYEELFTYGTSPYLQDTDSDNFSDKEEIDSGHDPLCAQGQKCTLFSSTSSAENLNINSSSSSNVTPSAIRDILRRAGAPPDKLSKISDEELLNLYNETVKETGISLTDLDVLNLGLENTPLNKNANFLPLNLSALKKLPPEKIRELLIQSGADENLLNQIDDKTLQSIFIQIIEEKEKQGITSSNQNINS